MKPIKTTGRIQAFARLVRVINVCGVRWLSESQLAKAFRLNKDEARRMMARQSDTGGICEMDGEYHANIVGFTGIYLQIEGREEEKHEVLKLLGGVS